MNASMIHHVGCVVVSVSAKMIFFFYFVRLSAYHCYTAVAYVSRTRALLSKCYDMACVCVFVCTREKPYNLCHSRDLWINIIIFVFCNHIMNDATLSTFSLQANTNARNIVCFLANISLFAQKMHTIKDERRVRKKARQKSRTTEEEWEEREKESKKSLCIWNFAVAKKHILHHVCRFFFTTIFFLLFGWCHSLLHKKRVCSRCERLHGKSQTQEWDEKRGWGQEKLQRNYFLESCHMVFKASNRQRMLMCTKRQT